MVFIFSLHAGESTCFIFFHSYSLWFLYFPYMRVSQHVLWFGFFSSRFWHVCIWFESRFKAIRSCIDLFLLSFKLLYCLTFPWYVIVSLYTRYTKRPILTLSASVRWFIWRCLQNLIKQGCYISFYISETQITEVGCCGNLPNLYPYLVTSGSF